MQSTSTGIGAVSASEVECRAEASVAEDGGEDPVCQLAQLGEGFGDFVHGVVAQCDEVVVAVRRGVGSCPSKVVGEAEQALLGAVVQVAFQLAASFVAGVDDPRPRLAELVHLGEYLGSQALVVEREAKVGTERSFELEWVAAVADHGDWCAVANDGRRDRAGVSRSGSGTGRPCVSA